MDTGAAAVIFDGKDRVLLIEENYDRYRWGLPGGALETGETPEEAVVRETLEEVGVAVTVDHLVGRYVFENGFTAYAFRCVIREGAPAVQDSSEIAAIEWCPTAHLPTPRSNVLHYAVPDAVLGLRNVSRHGLRRVS